MAAKYEQLWQTVGHESLLDQFYNKDTQPTRKVRDNILNSFTTKEVNGITVYMYETCFAYGMTDTEWFEAASPNTILENVKNPTSAQKEFVRKITYEVSGFPNDIIKQDNWIALIVNEAIDDIKVLHLNWLHAAVEKCGTRCTLMRSWTSPFGIVSSVFKKEIAYDEKSGRFFETGYGEGECIPDEEFCMTDNDSGEMIRLTVEEKERIFLDALQSYYSSGRKMLSDGEFDLLKEDLQWNGSPMVTMTSKEVKYMTAMQEYMKGSPVMPDAEFDKLKDELKEEGSKFAVQTEPKCYIDTGICKVTMEEDKFRSNLLYLPAGFVLMGLWLLFGYELIEPIIRINPVILSVLGLPWVYTGAKGFTESVLFSNKKIVFGPCPNCNFQNRVYFVDILGVEGFSDVADCKCPNCKEQFNVQRATLRASTLPKSV